MGLLYSNYECNPVNKLKINACSGGIYKTYKESWFVKFGLNSRLADKLFRKENVYYSTFNDKYDTTTYSLDEPKEVLVLQMIICGDMEVIAEVMLKEDFDKYFKDLEILESEMR